MANVHDVAAYILEKHGEMTTMKLQKLCYYSQAWSLVWDGQALFSEEIQAWANGPVIYELYDEHRGKFRVSSWNKGNRSNLTQSERETINIVLKHYGQWTGQQLSHLTHNEEPWLKARRGLPEGARSSTNISLETMHWYYTKLSQG